MVELILNIPIYQHQTITIVWIQSAITESGAAYWFKLAKERGTIIIIDPTYQTYPLRSMRINDTDKTGHRLAICWLWQMSF